MAKRVQKNRVADRERPAASADGSRDTAAPPLVLASASPRRRELLASVGLPVEVLAVDIDEAARDGEGAHDLARRLASEKALAAARLRPGRFVLAADTVVAIADHVLGKPVDRADARRMLALLGGAWHEVITGVALVAPDGSMVVTAALTRVRFAALDGAEIERYVAGTEPYDKAGGYAIQGAAGWFVEEVEGSPSNVVGLPLELVRRLLRDTGAPAPSLGS